jgi:peptide-methionine (R)-S-oxide reductase
MVKTFSDEELKKKLTPEQYKILREKGTEAPFSGKFLNHNEHGMYTCAVCGAELFPSDKKYESNLPGLAGWPSFYDVAKSSAVTLTPDNSLGMQRTEVSCASCGSHLGHLFDNDPDSPNNQHYCINSAALDFEPKTKK